MINQGQTAGVVGLCLGTKVIFAATVILGTLVLFAGALSTQALSGDLRVEASVDSRNVVVGDNLTLTITVYGDGKISQPDMTSLDGFEVVSSYSSQNISIVNARMSKSVSLQYVLLAVNEGERTLGPFTVRSGKDMYQTQPIAVRVTKGQAPLPQAGSQASNLIMAFAATDRKRAYVGEQITYTLTFAYRANVEDVAYIEPDHTGFWLEDVGQSDPVIRVIDGVKYYAITKTTALFPISSGRYTIGEAGVRYIVEDADAFSRDPFSFFGRDPFGARRRKEGIAKTEPIEIEALPLPSEGKPSNFSGAVGSFNLSVVPSAREVKVGESLTLSVKVEGHGNIKSIGEIPLPKIEGFRVFAPKSRDSVRVEQNRVGGAKIFDLVLVPERVGEYVLDGFNLAYFDPAKLAYVRTSAQPVKVNVLEGDEYTMRALAAGGGERRITKQDIRHIKRQAGIKDDLGVSPEGIQGVVFRFMPVFLGLAGIAVMIQRKHAASSSRTSVRKAFKTLARDLKAAQDMVAQDGGADASAVVSRAIRSYIAARKGIKESTVDAGRVSSIAEIPEERRCQVYDLLMSLDRVRFAPVSSSAEEMRGLIAETRTIMKKVDEEWCQ